MSNISAMILTAGLFGVGGAYYSAAPSSAYIAQERLDLSKQMFEDVQAAALTDYVKDGAWSANLTTLKSKGSYLGDTSGPYGQNLEFIPQGDGSSLIRMKVETAAQAKQLANLVGNGTASGTVVTKRLGTPAEGALRNSLLKDYVNINVNDKLEYQVDIDLNGNNIRNVDKLEALNVSVGTGGVDFGTTNIRESSAQNLSMNADNVNFSKNLSITGTLGTQDLTATNKITATTAELSTLDVINAQIQNLSTTKAIVDNAQIATLGANVAKFRNAAADTLTVSGLTSLASLVANDASFSGLVKSGSLELTGTAVVNMLEAQNIQVQNANITKAEVTELVAALAKITSINSDLVDSQKVVANYGQFGDLNSNYANIGNLVSTMVSAKTFDVESLIALNSELETATAKTLTVLGVTTVKNLDADTVTAKVAVIDDATINTLNTTTLTNSGKLTTKTLQVDVDANIGGNLNVAKVLTAKDVKVLNNATVAGTTTTSQLLVNADAEVKGVTTTKGLVVTDSATLNTVTAQTVNSSNMNVANTATAKNVTASNSMTIANNLISNSIVTDSATINGKLITQQIEAEFGSISTLNATSATVSSTTTTRNLVVTSLASLNSATVSNLVASVSNIGSATGTSLELANDISAKSGSFDTLSSSGAAVFGSFLVNGSATIQGPLTVNSTLTANSTNLSGTLTANSANVGSLSSSSITASGIILGSDVRNASGVSLNNLNSGFNGHAGRIVVMERWIADCKAKLIAECNR